MNGPLRRLALALLLTATFVASTARAEDRAAVLRDGVNDLAKPGVPGPIALVGESSFAVVAARVGDGSTQAVVAAAEHGKGRVVAFGHGGYLGGGALRTGDTARLVRNAVRWAARGRERPVVGVVGRAGIAAVFEPSTARVVSLPASGWPDRLESVHVLVLTSWDLGGADNEKALEAFVARGGGLITAGLIWGWRQLNPGRDPATVHRLNAVLAPMGLFFADGYVQEVLPAVEGDALAAVHAGRSLGRLEVGAKEERAQHGATVATAYRSLPAAEKAFRERVTRLVAGRTRRTVPTRKRPVKAEHALARLALLVEHLETQDDPPEKVTAAPSAADFPGGVPADATRVDAAVTVDLSVPGWAGTGLHVPPGEVVEILAPGDRPAGLHVRIGCHADVLWGKASWTRHPEVTRRFALSGPKTRVSSPHGGVLYVEVPDGRRGMLKLTIRGAVPAPRFVRGETNLEEWRTSIRLRAGPWAELQGEKIVLTVRSEDVRGLDDPEALLAFWDGALDLYAELGRRPLARRPQRIVCDRQIVAGYMHAGYPIMTHLDQSDRMVSVETLKAGAWGLWHELGHNHQRREWTFAGTGEVTCNLFSLFVEERLRGLRPAEHPWPKPKWTKVVEHLKGDRSFDRWKRDPGLALWTYILVQDEFGWEPFQKAFAVYEALRARERPRTDDQKRDRWLITLSRAVGKDLGPYFEAWGIPTSAAARGQVAALPDWMPEKMRAIGRSEEIR